MEKTFIFLKKIKKNLLDTLFPVKCLACLKEGAWLCNHCQRKIKLREQQVCPLCEKAITPDGRICFGCKIKSPLAGLVVATSYQEPSISKAVHLFKYRFIEELSRPLSDIILRAIREYEMPLPDIIIPIPLHSKRLRWRGFNQSLLLATNIAENLLPATSLKVDNDILLRKRHTLPQMSIKDNRDRDKNVRDAFTISNSSQIKGKRILLVDDICTTGSTIFECARTLKKAGAREVWATAIARQEYKKN